MNDTHFRTLDLNLLRVFVALLEEGSATRAGARLGLTQSAVSHALSRLRLSLGDELFVRNASGLQATPRALEMGASISSALGLLEAAVSASAFDPQVHERELRVAASAYTCSVLMPPVVRRLVKEAPGLRLNMQSLDGAVGDGLERGRLDMAIGAFEHVAQKFTHRPLFTDTGVWVMRAGHPAASDSMTADVLARLPQVKISNWRSTGGMASRDAGLRLPATWHGDYASDAAPGGAVIVPDVYAALAMVSQTEMVALLPRRLANLALQGGRVALCEPAGGLEPMRFGAVVRSIESETGPVGWLLNLLAEVAAGL